jgi:hypothetical protein
VQANTTTTTHNNNHFESIAVIVVLLLPPLPIMENGFLPPEDRNVPWNMAPEPLNHFKLGCQDGAVEQEREHQNHYHLPSDILQKREGAG